MNKTCLSSKSDFSQFTLIKDSKGVPDGEGWAVAFIQLSTHNGTHLDAPYHFHSTMNQALGEKERASTIDEVPLEWCFQPGVKLDFRHFADGYVVTAAAITPR